MVRMICLHFFSCFSSLLSWHYKNIKHISYIKVFISISLYVNFSWNTYVWNTNILFFYRTKNVDLNVPGYTYQSCSLSRSPIMHHNMRVGINLFIHEGEKKSSSTLLLISFSIHSLRAAIIDNKNYYFYNKISV